MFCMFDGATRDRLLRLRIELKPMMNKRRHAGNEAMAMPRFVSRLFEISGLPF